MKSIRTALIALFTILLLASCQGDDNTTDEDTSRPSDNNTEETEDDIAENDTTNKNNEGNNTTIDGTLWDGEGDIGVILSHGAVYDADSWEEQGEELQENGVVAFAVEDTSSEEIIDAANMLQDDHDIDKVAVIGASAGGATAIEAIDKGTVDFSKAVFLSPGGDASAIENMPVLVIYSEEEGFDDLEDTAEEKPDLETVAFPGGAHAQEIFEDEEKGNTAMDEIIAFLKE